MMADCSHLGRQHAGCRTARASCHTIGEAEVDHEGHSRESGAEPVAWAVGYARLEIEHVYSTSAGYFPRRHRER